MQVQGLPGAPHSPASGLPEAGLLFWSPGDRGAAPGDLPGSRTTVPPTSRR